MGSVSQVLMFLQYYTPRGRLGGLGGKVMSSSEEFEDNECGIFS